MDLTAIPNQIPHQKGSYLLVFNLDNPVITHIGKQADVFFQKGIYIYSGSAFGPGGLNARINRHLTINKKMKWHLDWIRPNLNLIYGWYVLEKNLECEWSKQGTKIDGYTIPLKKMGASDCKNRCEAHFVGLPSTTSLAEIKNQILAVSDAITIRFY